MMEDLIILSIVGAFVGFWPLIYGTNHDLFTEGCICFASTIFFAILGGLLLCVPCACVCICILKSCQRKKC